MRFEFANRLSGALFEPLFEDTAASLVDAFVRRARAERPARQDG
jgi:ribosome-associated toxin RatA of RatAB toxin-antitoxin module